MTHSRITRLKGARITTFVVACCWLLYSLWLVKRGWGLSFPKTFTICEYKIQQAVAWSVWTIATPAWFLFEYYLFNNAHPEPLPGELEKFKYNQDLAGKCWLAVAAVLLALYFGHDMKP